MKFLMSTAYFNTFWSQSDSHNSAINFILRTKYIEEAVTLESNLKDDLEADSLDAVELILAVEEEFGLFYGALFRTSCNAWSVNC